MTKGAKFILGAASALALLTAGAASAKPDCFFVNQWQGWKAASPNVIYLRVNISDIYRVDLSAGSEQLMYPDNHLVSVFRGTTTVCSPLDLQLAVSDGHGLKIPLIASRITRLTPEEVAALPRKDRP